MAGTWSSARPWPGSLLAAKIDLRAPGGLLRRPSRRTSARRRWGRDGRPAP